MTSILGQRRRITVSLDAASDLLDRPFSGSDADRRDLTDELMRQSAPEWVRTATFRLDAAGVHIEG